MKEVSYKVPGNEWDFELTKKSRSCWYKIMIRSWEREEKEDNRKHGIWVLIHHYGDIAFIVCKDTHYSFTSVLACRHKPLRWMNECRKGNSVLRGKINSVKKNSFCFSINIKHKIFNCASVINGSLSKLCFHGRNLISILQIQDM